jgi:hypothetical protein
VDAHPVTTPLVPHAGENIGELGELFNRMLEMAQGGLGSYTRMLWTGLRKKVAYLPGC